jgi:very-short-patch-repair endonuclease
MGSDHRGMHEVVIGGEALALGALTRGQLRWNYRPLFPGVYAPKAATLSLQARTVGAWLWSGRNGVIAGRAAAALHGARWVDAATPIEMIWRSGRPPPGVTVRNERLDADEVVEVRGLPVTSVARTALDLARCLPRDSAVRHLDALAQASGVTAVDALEAAARHPRARGLPRARVALHLMDGGAQSPRETALRLMLIDDGLPRPRTQIPVSDGFADAYIDMGYDEPKVGLDYDGAHHLDDRDQYVYDIGRAELIEGQGWIDIKVVKEHSRLFTLRRVRDALARRGWSPRFCA